MYTKILLFAIVISTSVGCSTAYKTGQTPDDVYYSPAKKVVEIQNSNNDQQNNTNNNDYVILMNTRDPRWRNFSLDYQYEYSPYYYSCNYTNHGYYYNPFYNPWPIYSKVITPVNHTPRMVNLSAYTGISSSNGSNPKTGNGINWISPSSRYNNTNRSNSSNSGRQVFTSGSGNNNRTYSPESGRSANNNSTPRSNSGTVTRPGRGGN